MKLSNETQELLSIGGVTKIEESIIKKCFKVIELSNWPEPARWMDLNLFGAGGSARMFLDPDTHIGNCIDTCSMLRGIVDKYKTTPLHIKMRIGREYVNFHGCTLIQSNWVSGNSIMASFCSYVLFRYSRGSCVKAPVYFN